MPTKDAQIDILMNYIADKNSLNKSIKQAENSLKNNKGLGAALEKTYKNALVSGARAARPLIINALTTKGFSNAIANSIKSSLISGVRSATPQMQKLIKTSTQNAGGVMSPQARSNVVNRAAPISNGKSLLGGIGGYYMGGMLGGSLGALGGGMMMGGGPLGKLGGGALLGIGMATKLATTVMPAFANNLGIGKEGIQNYMEFEKTIFNTTKNLDRAFDPQTMKTIGDAAKDLSMQFGAAGNALDYAVAFRRIAGSGVITGGTLKEQTSKMKEIAGVSAGMSLISEGATPEQTSLAILKIFSSLKAVGKGNQYSFAEIGAMINQATKSGLIEMPDISNQASAIAKATAQGTSLPEALTIMTLLGRTGFTAAQAGTGLVRLTEGMKQSSVVPKIAGVTGLTEKEVLTQPAFKTLGALVTKFKEGGIGEEKLGQYAQAIFPELRSSRAGLSLMTMLKEDADTVSNLLSDIKDTSSALKDFEQSIKEAEKLPINRIGNFFNMIQGAKLTAGGYVTPVLSQAAAMMTGRPRIDPTTGNLVMMNRAGSEVLKSVEVVAQEIRDEAIKNGDIAFLPLIDAAQSVALILEDLAKDPEKLKEILGTLVDAFGLLAKGIYMLAKILVSIAEKIQNFDLKEILIESLKGVLSGVINPAGFLYGKGTSIAQGLLSNGEVPSAPTMSAIEQLAVKTGKGINMSSDYIKGQREVMESAKQFTPDTLSKLLGDKDYMKKYGALAPMAADYAKLMGIDVDGKNTSELKDTISKKMDENKDVLYIISAALDELNINSKTNKINTTKLSEWTGAGGTW